MAQAPRGAGPSQAAAARGRLPSDTSQLPCHVRGPDPCHVRGPDPCHVRGPDPCHVRGPDPCH
ncbi:MAG: hypothetical protein JXA57_17475, partial [Armatimonadetes bacterium]|nr:hypothetical protein [Armatimonadota bacterium]